MPANAILAAAGYNFSLLVRWFEALLRALITKLLKKRDGNSDRLKSTRRGFFTDDYLNRRH